MKESWFFDFIKVLVREVVGGIIDIFNFVIAGLPKQSRYIAVILSIAKYLAVVLTTVNKFVIQVERIKTTSAFLFLEKRMIYGFYKTSTTKPTLC